MDIIMVGGIGIYELLVLVWGILCIILFFKIWGACNNIKKLANKYAPKVNQKSPTLETREDIDNWLNANSNTN